MILPNKKPAKNPDKINQAGMKKAEDAAKQLRSSSFESRIKSDVLGSYTGMCSVGGENGADEPDQDADDL